MDRLTCLTENLLTEGMLIEDFKVNSEVGTWSNGAFLSFRVCQTGYNLQAKSIVFYRPTVFPPVPETTR